MFTDVITTVCEKLANSIGFVYWPCIRLHDRIHGCGQAVYIAVYTARYTPRVHEHIYVQGHVYTDTARTRVHGRIHGRVCIRPVYTAVCGP